REGAGGVALQQDRRREETRHHVPGAALQAQEARHRLMPLAALSPPGRGLGEGPPSPHCHHVRAFPRPLADAEKGHGWPCFPRAPEPSTSLCSLRVEERGRGVVERGSLPRIRQFQSRFVRLPAPESLFSCEAKRKVTQREGHPGWRVPSIHGRNVREAVPGFSSGLGQPLLRCLNSGIHAVACPREKASPSMGSPAARPDRPRLTAAQGPRKSRRASCAPEASVPLPCSHAPLPSRGPSCISAFSG